MLNIDNGEIAISDDLIITPQFTFGQFKTTKYYNNQDEERIVYLDTEQLIDCRKYMVDLFFTNKKIYIVSLVCCDISFLPTEERKRKDLHDMILNEWGIKNKKYSWGEVSSVYDPRGNISSIEIIYH